jgi:hypothetical protein
MARRRESIARLHGSREQPGRKKPSSEGEGVFHLPPARLPWCRVTRYLTTCLGPLLQLRSVRQISLFATALAANN